nr:PREDICTED: probable LRR receptor-like serine/threonine-protein kinase At3g47570 [Daucus carota subsp. sativus]
MIFPFIISCLLVSATPKIFVFAFRSNDTDQQALLSFKASVDDPSGALDSWNTSMHFCQWRGVTCSSRRERVIKLNISDQQLGGRLSPHIGNLSFLRGLYVYQNNFHGSIPNEIGLLFRLQYLNLRQNYFTGGFPANLSYCTDIRKLSMSNNELEGKLPTEFSSWSKLDRFDARVNHFTGSIPPSIGNVSSLLFLDLAYNNLVGGIPLELAHHTSLQFLNLGVNGLGGLVPPSLYNSSSLYVVGLNQNVLEGTLPSDLGFTLPKLQGFYGEGNLFSGPLPPSIVNASNLVNLDISANSITGPIPINWDSLPNLEVLGLGQNPLADYSQLQDWIFFNSLVNCTLLTYLDFSQNGLRGKLPSSIVNLSTTIETLYLFGNQIYGTIPREIGKLVNMKDLGIARNFLTGTIPDSIGELSQLGELDFGANNISGVIPTSIGNMTQLGVLSLEYNMLRGSLPPQLFNISTIQEVYLSNNSLGGIIPAEIGFSSQCLILYLDQNLFTGPLTFSIGNLKQLVTLDVSNNRLTGEIPTTLGDCVMLEGLYMEGNLFQGRIPSSFQALKSLHFLDLSNNNISEDIPNIFDGFHLIEFLNLSHNKLGGEVPRQGLFSNISAFSVDGNLRLCGGIQALQLPSCPVEVSKNKKKTFSLKIILPLVLLPLGILACLALICYRRQNSKQLQNHVLELQENQYLKVSYQDLMLATNEFSTNNILGEGRYGSVYKGVLKSVEHIVAVKVLNNEVHGANKSFIAECEALSNIRHRNLVKIITICSSTDFKGNDFKALVFEFMTNGSVDNWLHPGPNYQGNKRNLTLLQRINISIDVALGLDYLHHHGHEKIIHCDIKPSNILLDEDFVAHIGDFGLARFSYATRNDISQAQMTSTGVGGTIGYVPPEYGMGGETSIEGDVYSYGILLLEIFSGKRPTESSIVKFDGGNLHEYIRNALPYKVMDIADPRILLDQDEHELNVNQSYSRPTLEVCLASVFEVGILCSQEMPQRRMDISIAIKQLHAARDKLLQAVP